MCYILMHRGQPTHDDPRGGPCMVLSLRLEREKLDAESSLLPRTNRRAPKLPKVRIVKIESVRWYQIWKG